MTKPDHRHPPVTFGFPFHLEFCLASACLQGFLVLMEMQTLSDQKENAPGLYSIRVFLDPLSIQWIVGAFQTVMVQACVPSEVLKSS